ncbi:LAFA_0D08592g1_1 [Lachancea sp. 'fantastica']|nr:LAFA_0D08592g1_1 [Lachancea sp. 'fantastica']
MNLGYLQICLIIALRAFHVLGSENASEAVQDSATDGNVPQRANFEITYETLEKGPGGVSSFLEFDDGDNVTLRYSFSNRDDSNVSVVAVGGAIYDITTNELAANVSAAALGPIPIGTNETAEFQQIVNLILKEGDYAISPDIYVEKEQETIKVIANPSLLRILPPTMSFFNPQFMFVQLILAALIAGFSYMTFVRTREDGNARTNGKKYKSSEAAKTQKLDSTWLPESHHAKRSN